MSSSATSTPRSPGSYRHPAMDELQRINQKTGNKGENIQTIVQNFIAFAASFFFPSILQSYKLVDFDNASYFSFTGVLFLCLCTVRLVFVGNIIYCIGNLRQNDTETRKLALTPAQRQLMGVDPKAVGEAIPGKIETPPRKPKIFPKSLIGSPGFDSTSGNFPSIVPGTTSPLRRAEQESRASFGHNGFSRGPSSGIYSPKSVFDTPSPVTFAVRNGDTDGPVINEKWRYEKLSRRGDSLMGQRAPTSSIFSQQ